MEPSVYERTSEEPDTTEQNLKDDSHSLILYDVPIPSTTERLKLFNEVDIVLKKFKDLQEVITLQNKWKLNETHVVLLETLQDREAHETFNRTNDDDMIRSPLKAKHYSSLISPSKRGTKSTKNTSRLSTSLTSFTPNQTYSPIRVRRSARKSVN